jgi:hypothetical protein
MTPGGRGLTTLRSTIASAEEAAQACPWLSSSLVIRPCSPSGFAHYRAPLQRRTDGPREPAPKSEILAIAVAPAKPRPTAATLWRRSHLCSTELDAYHGIAPERLKPDAGHPGRCPRRSPDRSDRVGRGDARRMLRWRFGACPAALAEGRTAAGPTRPREVSGHAPGAARSPKGFDRFRPETVAVRATGPRPFDAAPCRTLAYMRGRSSRQSA